MPTRTFNLGRILPKPKGSYDAEETYDYLDVVYYNGSSYVALQTTVGNVPTNTTYWQIVAAAGELSGTLTAEQITAIVSQVLATAGLVVDANYVHTDNNLTDALRAAIENITTPGTGVLTIQRNGSVVGTFSADASGNVTINITVPESVTDLSGGSALFGPLDLIEVAEVTDGVIDSLKSACVYSFEQQLTSLVVSSLGYTATDIARKVERQHTFIYFVAASSFSIAIPEGCYINTPSVSAGHAYKLEVEGDYFTLTEYSTQS